MTRARRCGRRRCSRHALDTVQRVSGGRLIAGLGAGDSQIKAENDAFGIEFGDAATRLASLVAAVGAVNGRGYPVWVGGSASRVRDARRARRRLERVGWDRRRVRAGAAEVHEVAPAATLSWGGLVLLGRDDEHAAEKARTRQVGPHVIAGGPDRVARALASYADAGASWIIAGPLDATDPANVDLLAEHILPRLRPGGAGSGAGSVVSVEQE